MAKIYQPMQPIKTFVVLKEKLFRKPLMLTEHEHDGNKTNNMGRFIKP